jgi:hypothetical protein
MMKCVTWLATSSLNSETQAYLDNSFFRDASFALAERVEDPIQLKHPLIRVTTTELLSKPNQSRRDVVATMAKREVERGGGSEGLTLFYLSRSIKKHGHRSDHAGG